MVSNSTLSGRYQFIKTLGARDDIKTYLMADLHYPGHPKCVVKHLRLPARNSVALTFVSNLLKKKVDLLEKLGSHDRIPQILSHFKEEHNFYLVRQYISGHSLNQEVGQGIPCPEPQVIAMLRDLLELLVYVQEHGVIHRNIRPDNVIRRDIDEELVLIDFGLVKDVNTHIPEPSSNGDSGAEVSIPSPFTAPEQHLHQAHFNTDYFALGMIAIQAATGLPTTALPLSNQPDFLDNIQSCLQQMPRQNQALQKVLLKMVHPSSVDRYQKAIAILRDLEALISPASLPTAMRPDPQPEPTQAPTRQFPWRIMGILGGLGVVALFATLLLVHLPQRMRALILLQQGQSAKQEGQVNTAIDRYSEALQIDPDNAQARSQRGNLYLEQGNLEQALQDLTIAIEQSPESADLFYKRGNLRFQSGDLQGSIQDYTEAIQQDPTYATAYINRGSARAQWGDDQGAVEDYSAALTLDPGPEVAAAAYLNRCLSYSNMGDQTAAHEDCTQAINLRPHDSLAYENRGLVRRRMQDFEGSLRDYTIALQISPASPEPYYNRALTRKALGDSVGAIEDLNRAIDVAPDHVFAHYDRGLLNAEQGNIDAAIEDLQKAAQMCLDLGRVDCYEDAQFQLKNLQDN